MWQYITICVIGIFVSGYLLKKIYDFFFIKKGRIDKCSGCRGCSMSKVMDKRIRAKIESHKVFFQPDRE